ncbi:MAG: phosphoserine phosphatase SerB [Halobacteriales archaeon]
MNNRDYELVVFDLDSTLVDGEGIVALAERAGVEDEVAEVTERAMRGELDFGDSLRQRVALLEGLDYDEAVDALTSMPLVENVVDVVGSIDADVAVFSGGFYPAVERVAELVGAEHVRANRLGVQDGVLTGEVDGELVDTTKAEALRELATQLDVDLEDVVVVGDGSNDVPMFEIAGCSIAFDGKPIARDAADHEVDRRDFADVEPLLRKKRVIE